MVVKSGESGILCSRWWKPLIGVPGRETTDWHPRMGLVFYVHDWRPRPCQACKHRILGPEYTARIWSYHTTLIVIRNNLQYIEYNRKRMCSISCSSTLITTILLYVGKKSLDHSRPSELSVSIISASCIAPVHRSTSSQYRNLKLTANYCWMQKASTLKTPWLKISKLKFFVYCMWTWHILLILDYYNRCGQQMLIYCNDS